jgi:hypothetical protein
VEGLKSINTLFKKKRAKISLIKKKLAKNKLDIKKPVILFAGFFLKSLKSLKSLETFFLENSRDDFYQIKI